MVLFENSQDDPSYSSQLKSDAAAHSDTQSGESDGTGIDIGSLSRCSSISSTLLAPAGLLAALSAQEKRPLESARSPAPISSKRAKVDSDGAWYSSAAAMQLQRSPDQQVHLESEPSKYASECESAELSCVESVLGGGNPSIKLHSLVNPGTLPATSAGPSDEPKEAEEDLFDMLSNLRELEAELRPSADYMSGHGSEHQPALYIDESMRRIAVSWLVEVSCESCLHQETLFLATSLLDRFLSITTGVPRDVLQLISVACVLIAAKHEEEMHPSVLHLTRMADHCFEERDLLQMERTVLNSLGFRINTPTAYTFWSVYRLGHAMHNPTASLASYLMELALLDYSCLKHEPSRLAAAALLVAEAHTGVTANLERLTAVTGYTPICLQECAADLVSLHCTAAAARSLESPYMPVIEKYRCQEWFFTSQVAPLSQLPPGFGLNA